MSGDEIVWAVSESQLHLLLESARAGDSIPDIMLRVEDEFERVVDKSEEA